MLINVNIFLDKKDFLIYNSDNILEEKL